MAFSNAKLTGTVLQRVATAAAAAAPLSNSITVGAHLAVASGSFVFIRMAPLAQSAAGPGAPTVSWHCTRVIQTAAVAGGTELFLLDALPSAVAANATVYVSTKQRDGRNIGGAGLVRVEGGVLGLRTVAFGGDDELGEITAWGRTQQWRLSDLTFYNTLCGIQLDTSVEPAWDDRVENASRVHTGSVIETGTVRNIVLRGGSVLAAVLDSGSTNGVMWSHLHIWPADQDGEPKSFACVVKDNRGFPFYVPELGRYWSGPLTLEAIAGSHLFSGLYMHGTEVGLVASAGMQDTYRQIMGDGVGVLLWFRQQTWGHLVSGVNCAYVGICAKLSERATSISFADVMAPGNAPQTFAGIEVGQGSSAYLGTWMAVNNPKAGRVVGKGAVWSLATNSLVASASPRAGLCTAVRNASQSGQSRCPATTSCNGIACTTAAAAAGVGHGYGRFDDENGTAAFGCYLEGRVATAAAGGQPGCRRPAANVSVALGAIAGWGTQWSGAHPPWAYNMNTACPCQP